MKQLLEFLPLVIFVVVFKLSGTTLTIAEFEGISLTVCVGGLIAYMVFIIGQLAWESRAGKYGALWMFVGLGVGFIGFMAKGIIQRFAAPEHGDVLQKGAIKQNRLI